MDTSPETSGKDVKPQVIRNYRGGDIVLPANPQQVIRASENPELEKAIGHTLITSDGTTLLGADDKAGLAIIMEAAAWLMEHPEIIHGPIRLCFTCDEEVGRGVEHIDIGQIGAVGLLHRSTATAATKSTWRPFRPRPPRSRIRGVNIHPSIAKGRMTNALRVAADFLARLPRDRLAPEATDGREGFIHPLEISGGVGEVKIRFLLRDFETRSIGRPCPGAPSGGRRRPCGVPRGQIRHGDYTHVSEYGRWTCARTPGGVLRGKGPTPAGAHGQKTIVRGGTDGSRLTELGLPTPNLSSGAHSIHSPKEWASLDEMACIRAMAGGTGRDLGRGKIDTAKSCRK